MYNLCVCARALSVYMHIKTCVGIGVKFANDLFKRAAITQKLTKASNSGKYNKQKKIILWKYFKQFKTEIINPPHTRTQIHSFKKIKKTDYYNNYYYYYYYKRNWILMMMMMMTTMAVVVVVGIWNHGKGWGYSSHSVDDSGCHDDDDVQ